MSRPEGERPLSIAEMGGRIKNGELTPLQLVEGYLERIRRHNGGLNALWRVDEEPALQAAEKAGRQIADGGWRGPLHGVPFAIKDLFDLAGQPTAAGSVILKDNVARQDSFAVARLKEAGAIPIGRTAMHEFAFGITSRNPHYGPTLNPWDVNRMCGGSSGGSGAAVAAGLAPFALGTDTGGSIRIPSALCGIVGLKPSFGLVGRSGVVPLAFSLDHVGPMARYVDDLGQVLAALAGHDPADPASRQRPEVDYPAARLKRGELTGLTVGRPANFFNDGLSPEVAQATEDFFAKLAGLGARVVEVEIPLAVQADRAALAILFSEAAACLKIHADIRPQEMDPEVLHNVLLGQSFPAHRYVTAQRVRADLALRLKQEVFSRVDFLLAPACTIGAPPIDAEEVNIAGQSVAIRPALTRFMRFFNLAGLPVLSLPAGFSQDSMPLGVQLVGAPFTEAKLLAAGKVIQEAYPLSPFGPEL